MWKILHTGFPIFSLVIEVLSPEKESCLLSFPPSLERGQCIQGTQVFEGEIVFLISFSIFQLLFTTVFNFKALVTKQTYSERADLLIKQARNI